MSAAEAGQRTACAKCKGKLGAKYWSDVPGIGDLCVECHAEWIDNGVANSAPQKKQKGHVRFGVPSAS